MYISGLVKGLLELEIEREILTLVTKKLVHLNISRIARQTMTLLNISTQDTGTLLGLLERQ